MALINCPECNKQISDKAIACPHCGLPASYFNALKKDEADEKVNVELSSIDYKNLNNVLTSFDSDYYSAFSSNHYVTSHEFLHFKEIYSPYYESLSNPLIMQYLINNAKLFRIDITLAKTFVANFSKFPIDIEIHNKQYVDKKLKEYEFYFDNILKDIDPNIKLDEEQRRAVITDDNHCLLVAGAGAGKTTTMAAKVKYLVEKQNINPEEIIVISYTNKAINELKDRINKGLKIKAKVCTFHSFAYELVKQFNSEPPEVNFSSYKIVFDMLEKSIFKNKQLMRNLVLFMGYYFDLTEDVFKFDNLEQYHLIKASQDYETLKSGLGEYIKKIESQRERQVKTITGEYLRSIQEVQIANFLYLNNIDYEYEKVYPYVIPGARKKYTPDFYISQGENSVYLEHYGITENFYSNIFTPEQLYSYKKVSAK